ncbi:selenide, water dikinase SelD [Treponema phagedenis]|uniref:Selenide, water dikinase n=1 Tax=Treponema phagedenis TaxID=162 RepID=A0A0B7GWY0_TREPH|nr:selenide, water dikinase SelD [Treponema phagedenis]QEJ95880.1 selenide, water dikinase SelD [Treponema phagedenis]QEJ98884.1 selenide, water dikinase SelD [Treponema phagedenis]QEK00424.1 selenide, water dikinase SelD [Treponema phagedenis]QEK04391.1 selenide, water dikinase SelD [Treponema phagedenis]QEK05434.1 selenide, water dikinase SelD [Treponema phagedenis]
MKLNVCGGCNAKIAAGSLEKILESIDVFNRKEILEGFSGNEDAAVIKLSDEIAVVLTADFFPPMVEDGFIFGEIAAANALSDVYAMGAEPVAALNLVCFPEDEDKAILEDILKGGASKLKEAEVALVGGHSIHDPKIKYGLCVLGVVNPDKIYKNNTSKIGDMLVLTKPLGVGLLSSGMSVGEIHAEDFKAAVASMRTLNKYALEIIKNYAVRALTDVTGFGLIGHLSEMVHETAIINTKDIKVLQGAKKAASEFLFTAGGQRNRNSFESLVDFQINDFAMEEILFDPQTSGGLLISVAKEDAKKLCEDLVGNAIDASIIGEIVPKENKKIIVR